VFSFKLAFKIFRVQKMTIDTLPTSGFPSLSFKVFIGVASAMLFSAAQAQIYRCDNNGVIDYNNSVNSAKSKNCTVASLPAVTTIPAPVLPPPKAAPTASASPASSTSTPKPATSTAAASPGGFPRVDASTQRARDTDRAAILGEERRKESTRLEELKKEFNNGEPERRGDERNYQRYLDRVEKLKEEIQRSEGNVKSLDREIQGAKG
jgi:hypothetical protein